MGGLKRNATRPTLRDCFVEARPRGDAFQSLAGLPACIAARARPRGLGAAGCFCGRPALGAMLFSLWQAYRPASPRGRAHGGLGAAGCFCGGPALGAMLFGAV